MRVLAIDVGYSLGHGLVQHDGPVSSGTYRVPGDVRHLGQSADAVRLHLTKLIADLCPDVIAVAEPWIRRFPVPTASSIRPLFGFETVVEMVAHQFNCEMVEVSEQEARGYFMSPVPKGSKAQKAAAVQACRDRGWKIDSEHAADAMLIAAYVLAIKDPDRQHQLMPLYQRRKKAA